MKRIGLMVVVALTLALLACAAGTPPPEDQTASQAQSVRPKGKLLVERLPVGVEGLELEDGELKVQAGYDFVELPKNTFAVARARDGQHVSVGGCGCSALGDCKPVFSPDGIIVCQAQGLCIGSCGLAVTVGGTSTDIIMY